MNCWSCSWTYKLWKRSNKAGWGWEAWSTRKTSASLLKWLDSFFEGQVITPSLIFSLNCVLLQQCEQDEASRICKRGKSLCHWLLLKETSTHKLCHKQQRYSLAKLQTDKHRSPQQKWRQTQPPRHKDNACFTAFVRIKGIKNITVNIWRATHEWKHHRSAALNISITSKALL